MNYRNPLHIKVLEHMVKNRRLQSTAMVCQVLEIVDGQARRSVARWLSLQYGANRLQRHALENQYYYSMMDEKNLKPDLDKIIPVRQVLVGMSINPRTPEPVKDGMPSIVASNSEEFFAAGGQKIVLPSPDFTRPDLRRRTY